MRVKSLFALAALAVLSGSLHSASAQMAPLRPDYLKPGDKVAVISPSYAPAQDDSTVFRACEVLRSWGLVPVEGQFVRQGKNLDKDLGVKGLPFVLRYEDFLWALRDDEIKAIIPSRGGYGGIHFVDRLDLADISAHPKWIVGYSDITNFHLAWYNAGVMSIHGNMCIDLCKQKGDEPSRNRLRDLLFGKVPIYNLPPEENNIPGKAEGILLGGNFITMEALFGTSWDLPKDRPMILFVEEIEESMHAIDRMFNILIKQGRLDCVKGLIFGGFTDCEKDLGFASIEKMLYLYVKNLGIPVCFGFPTGHIPRNYPLVEGATATLEVSAEGTVLKFAL